MEVIPAVGGPASAVFRVENLSQVGEARRAGEALGVSLGMSENERGTLAIVITEVATNLARHARAGRVLLGVSSLPGAVGVDVTSVDEGPGIMNVVRAMEDGYSSAGTSGHGLGAIRRLASTFDIYSRAGDRAGCGTILVASVLTVASSKALAASGTLPSQIGVTCVSYDGGRVCGDAWDVMQKRDKTVAVLVDGLGHGPDAALAASEAIRVIAESAEEAPSQLMDFAHGALRSTRGAALAIATIDYRKQTLDFAGIGNISVALHMPDNTSRSLASLNGTVGHAIRRIQEFRYEWPAGALLVMHTDGILSRWRMDNYPGLLRHHPQLLSGALYRDAFRGRDDATIVALREQPS